MSCTCNDNGIGNGFTCLLAETMSSEILIHFAEKLIDLGAVTVPSVEALLKATLSAVASAIDVPVSRLYKGRVEDKDFDGFDVAFTILSQTTESQAPACSIGNTLRDTLFSVPTATVSTLGEAVGTITRTVSFSNCRTLADRTTLTTTTTTTTSPTTSETSTPTTTRTTTLPPVAEAVTTADLWNLATVLIVAVVAMVVVLVLVVRSNIKRKQESAMMTGSNFAIHPTTPPTGFSAAGRFTPTLGSEDKWLEDTEMVNNHFYPAGGF